MHINLKEDMGGIRLSYIFVFFAISTIFLLQLYSTIINKFFEMDLWWMMPSLFYYTDGKSIFEIIKFIFGTEPYMLGSPMVKMFLFVVTKYFGPQPKNYIFILLVFHFLNALLLFLLSKRLKLDFRIGFFAALIYLTLYAHFESYMWPFNMQHLSVTFFILLVLNLYLKTDKIIINGERYGNFWFLTLLVNFIATFSRMSIFILPIVILTHILFYSKDEAERIKKYDIWMPLFVSYLIYPLITFTSVGDDQADVFLRIQSIPPVLNWIVFFVVGIICLVLLRFLIKSYSKFLRQRNKWVILSTILSGIWVILILKDIRNLILPYNIIVPFSAVLNSFFNPLQSVLLLDSTEWSYQIHSQMSPFGFFIGIIFAGVFLTTFVSENRQLGILFVWYLIPFAYLNLYSNILSRYMVYITPPICLIMSSVMLSLYDYITANINFKKAWKEVIISLIFIALMIPNITAIRLELFRQNLACNFYLYDYIRAASIIKNDIDKNKEYLEDKNKVVYISNVKPMPFKEMWSFVPIDSENLYNFRVVLSQVINTIPIDNFRVNENLKDRSNDTQYLIQDGKIINASGEDVDNFSKLFAEGVRKFSDKDYADAGLLFEKAVRMRPFFINYILQDYQIEDSIWITNGRDLNSWINRMTAQSLRGDTEKVAYIRAIIKSEISTYMQALFYLSYLKHISGKEEDSNYWFSKIPYLMSDVEKVASMLSDVPEIKSDNNAMLFLREFTDINSLGTSFLWVKLIRDRVPTDFQLFVVKFLFNGKINKIVDDRANRYMKKYRHKRIKPHSMPETL